MGVWDSFKDCKMADIEYIMLLQESKTCSRDAENPSIPKDRGLLDSTLWKIVSAGNSEKQLCNYGWKDGPRVMLYLIIVFVKTRFDFSGITT